MEEVCIFFLFFLVFPRFSYVCLYCHAGMRSDITFSMILSLSGLHV